MTCWKEYIILLTHLIWHHLTFIYLDMSSISYRDMNSRKDESLFWLSKKFWIKFRPIYWLVFWRLDEKVTAMYWYQ
jgi:hypothetical protein